MNHHFKKRIAWLSLIIYAGFAVVMGGLQTNWYRYPASLEAFAVLLPLVIFATAVVGFHSLFLFSRYRDSALLFVLGLVSAGLGISITLWMSKLSQGVYLPNWYTNDVSRNDPQQLVTKAGELTYFLELHNPFATSHEEKLVLEVSGKRTIISLPLFPRSRMKVTLQNYLIGAACNAKRWIRRLQWEMKQAKQAEQCVLQVS